MAAGEEIVRISYANLEQMVFSSQADAGEHQRKGVGKSQRYQKSRRPAQQIYRPGQLRQTKGQKSEQRNGESEGRQAIGGGEEEDWDAVDLKASSADEDRIKESRESSGDVNDNDIYHRLDDLYIESPPREVNADAMSSWQDQPDSLLSHEVDTSGGGDDRRGDLEKEHRGKRRGKRPDIQIYIPKGRLGDRENRSEEKEPMFEHAASPKSGGDRFPGKGDDQEEFDEIVVSDSADSPRKVQMKNKGGSMRVTVMNEPPAAGGESSPSTCRRDLSSIQKRNIPSKQEPHYKELAESELHKRQYKGKNIDQRSKNQPPGCEKYIKPSGQSYEGAEKAKGKPDFRQNDARGGDEVRKQPNQKQERPVKSYSKNRRSNSSDSRPQEGEQDDTKTGKFGKEQFSSDTFPRAKGLSGKNGGREVFSQNKSGKEGKGSTRDGDKFYWGMRRQRTGSISSEASVASNPSNGSIYSGSSDFTEDDEPEHILNWGEEVEKAHLEELARLVHDGAQKLTSSLDAYPNCSPDTVVDNSNKGPKVALPTNLQKPVPSEKVHHGKDKEGRTRRRNRHRKTSSQHGSRDSSVHSGIQGDDGYSDGGRRRRRRRNSQGCAEQQQHPYQQHRQQQQLYEDRSYGDNTGDGPRGNRSGLQVTVGHNNRHVEISRGSLPRQRHRSDEKWDPHVIKDYDVEEEEEDWDREIDQSDEREVRRGGRQYSQQRWDKDMPPRFRKDSGGTGGRGMRGGGSHGGRESESHRHQGSRGDMDRYRRDSFDSQIKSDDGTDWSQQKELNTGGFGGDQRVVHPAHDASGSAQRPSNRGKGRATRQGQAWRSDDHMEQRRPVERAASLNHDDLIVSHKTHSGGLLRLPSQAEPPRPHSNPNPVIHTDHSFHHHLEIHRGGASNPPVGSNTRGPAQGRRQLFDPKNPSKPIVISDNTTSALKFEDTDMTPSPGLVPGSVGVPSSPDSPHSYPPAFYPPMFGYRLPMPPFPPPPNPFMAGFPPGSIPPHVFYRFPRMASQDVASFYSGSDLDTEGMMSSGSKAQCRMMAEQILRDSHPFDSQLGNILSRRPHSEDSLRMVNQIRAELQNRLEQVILLDIEVANKHNVEQMLWKSVYYQMIESLRKRLTDESQDTGSKQRLMEVLDEGTRFFENLLKKLQSTYDFDLEVFTDGNRPVPENVNRSVKLALLSSQRVMMFLGDIARYREQSSDTTNYGKARHWYLKAQRIQPRNGRPYNQLAILAVYTRRKLDAVYYYMRSLAASNPILTARESLMSLFDEVRKKVDAVEKKRFEERRQRQALRRKRLSRGPRVEIWVLPDGTSTQDRVGEDEDEEDLSSLSAIELNKRFVLTYLNVHGKLFTKINFEVFAESSSLMLQEFQTLIQHSPCVFSSTRLLQLMVINMFSVDNCALKDESLEEKCRSLLQEHAVEVGLEMFGLLVKRASELMSAQLENQRRTTKTIRDKNGRVHSQEESVVVLLRHRDSQKIRYKKSETLSENPLPGPKTTSSTSGDNIVIDEDLHLLLPALKTWVDWMMCHAHLWNPQPLNRPPDLGPHVDVWKNLAVFCDLLNSVETKQGCLIREQQPGYEPIILHEDTTLAGFVPMLSAPQEVFYADSSIDQQQAEDWLRIEKLRLFGEYLCGVEPPMLAFNVESSRYYSVAPSPTRSEDKLVTDSTGSRDSGDESDDVVIEHDDTSDDGNKDIQERDDIEKLKAKKAELNRKREEREKNKENMEAILDSHRHGKIELEIRPIFLIPDTNCFIDHFTTLKKILHTKKYTVVVPLVVINELDGLTRGARDQQYDSPDHAHMVKSQAQAAVEFLESEFEVKNPNLRAQTSKGSVLETIDFRSEESDGSGINDDIILNCCLHYCKDMAREFMPKDKDHPVRLYREVVLLTDDRNLRLKAHTCNVPVKDVPSFKKWSRLL